MNRIADLLLCSWLSHRYVARMRDDVCSRCRTSRPRHGAAPRFSTTLR